MRFLMDLMSGISYFINQAISEKKYRGLKEFDFEEPLTRLIWIASILCITTSYGMSWLLIGGLWKWADEAVDLPPALVAIGFDYQLRYVGGGVDSGIHQSVYQFAFEARARNRHGFPRGGGVANHSLGPGGRQLQRFLEGHAHHGSDGGGVLLQQDGAR